MKKMVLSVLIIVILLVTTVKATELTFDNSQVYVTIGLLNSSNIDCNYVTGASYDVCTGDGGAFDAAVWKNANQTAREGAYFKIANMSTYLTSNGYNSSISLGNYITLSDLGTYNLTVIGYIQSTNTSMKAYVDSLPTGTDPSAYKLSNFTSNYDARTDRFLNANFTSLFPTSYESQAYFKIVNMSTYLSANEYNKSIDLSGYLKSFTELDPIFIADTSRYQLSNFTSNYDSKTDRFGNSNFTVLYELQSYFKVINFTSLLSNYLPSFYNKGNFTADYENQAYWKLSNFTTSFSNVEGALFKIGNISNLMGGNCSTGQVVFGFYNNGSRVCVTDANSGGVSSGGNTSSIGTTNYIPFFSNSTFLNSSVISQFNSKIGIGETAPGATLSVSGGQTIGSSIDTTTPLTNGLDVEGSVRFGFSSNYTDFFYNSSANLVSIPNSELGSLWIPVDSGDVTLVDYPITSNITANTSVSYGFNIDGTQIFTIKALGNGTSGTVRNTTTIVNGTTQSKFMSSDGTIGFTGTCTIIGLTNFVVKDGIITGCS